MSPISGEKSGPAIHCMPYVCIRSSDGVNIETCSSVKGDIKRGKAQVEEVSVEQTAGSGRVSEHSINGRGIEDIGKKMTGEDCGKDLPDSTREIKLPGGVGSNESKDDRDRRRREEMTIGVRKDGLGKMYFRGSEKGLRRVRIDRRVDAKVVK